MREPLVGRLAAYRQPPAHQRTRNQALYNTVAEKFGRIDVLFNNAGIALADDGSLLDTDRKIFNRLLEVNTLSVFLCCKHGLSHLIRNGGGSVVLLGQ